MMKMVFKIVALLFFAAGVKADNIYVASFSGGAIEKFAANGSGTPFAYNLNAPEQMVFDDAGNLFLANYGDDTVLKFATNGAESVFASVSGGPNGLAFDNAGNLYVATFDGGAIEKFSPDGVDLGVFASGLDLPIVLAFDSGGNLYVGTYENKIEKFSPDGTDLGIFAGGVNGPTGMAFDAAGNLFVSDFWGNGISEFAPNGALVGTLTSKNLDGPYFLAFDSATNLYVASFTNGIVEKFAPDGSSSVFATIDSPTSLAIWPGLSLVSPNAADLKLISSANGKVTLRFSGDANSTFTVVASTNLFSPMSDWISLGAAIWQSNNIFQFTDIHATNRARFYGIRSP